MSRDVLQVQRLPAPASLHGERGVDCLSRASPGQPEAAQPVPEGHLLGREGRREEAGTQQEEDQGVHVQHTVNPKESLSLSLNLTLN